MYYVKLFFFLYLLEEGLERAQSITKALYEGSLEALADLSDNEMKSTFVGAPVYEILLQPGMTIMDLAMKAQCYANDSKNNENNFYMS